MVLVVRLVVVAIKELKKLKMHAPRCKFAAIILYLYLYRLYESVMGW